MREQKPIIEEDKLGKNPFLVNLRIPVNKMVLSGQYKADKEGLLLPVEIELEKEVTCKIYLDAVRRKQMVAMSPRAKDLLLWVLYETETGKDWIWINKTRYMAECGVKSYNTYKDAVRELVSNGFIQPTILLHVYWINPHLFFNGSRINSFPRNLDKK